MKCQENRVAHVIDYCNLLSMVIVAVVTTEETNMTHPSSG